MSANLSSNKVRVSNVLGSDGTLGYMDPAANMRVRHGIDTRWIVGLDSGNFQVSLAVSSGGAAVAKAYPHWLIIDAVDASGFGWPTGGGSKVFTHEDGVNASGPPKAVNSGMVYLKGSGSAQSFTR